MRATKIPLTLQINKGLTPLPSITCQSVSPTDLKIFCPDKQQGDWTGRLDRTSIREPYRR